MAWKFEYTYTADAHMIGRGNHVEKTFKIFPTRAAVLKYAYSSHIGLVSTNTRGRLYNTNTGKMVAYIDDNHYYTMDSRGNIYCQYFKYSKLYGDKWKYESYTTFTRDRIMSYVREKFIER